MPIVNETVVSIDERDINSGRVMEKTLDYVYAQGMLISVPNHYTAYVIPEEGETVKVRACQKKKLSKFLPSELIGKKFSVLYVNNRKLNMMSWGIGSLPITYEFLGDACVHVGASGTLIPRISDPVAFFKALGRLEGTLNLTECSSAITTAFRRLASEILVELFNEAAQPIFETTFMVSEMARRINERVCGIELDRVPGIVFESATVTGIRVNEADKAALVERFGKRKR